jgi:hypothetical protein
MDIFFHVYLKSGYSRILLNKFKKFKDSGLYEKTNKIYLTLFGGEINLHLEFLNELRSVYPKIELVVISNPEFNNEPDTLNFMLEKAKEYSSNTPMLYLHTKGLSYTHPLIKKNVEAWVRYLDLYTINKWEENITSLDSNDVSGPFFCDGIDNRHFQGNFWWANSSYIKGLPKITPDNFKQLNRGEYWACSKAANINAMSPISPVDLYQTYFCNESDFPSGW